MIKIALTTSLGLIGGYVDVICFVRFGVFAATMTGNLVFIGRSLLFFFLDCPRTDPDNRRYLCVQTTKEEVAYGFMVIFSHLLGVFTMVVLQRCVPPRRAVPLAAPALAFLVLWADLLPAALWFSGAGEGPTAVAKQWSVCFVALALGATHYAASPVSDDSFLAAPAFAATVHMARTRETSFRRVPGATAPLRCTLRLAGCDAHDGEDIDAAPVQPSRGRTGGEAKDVPGLLHGRLHARGCSARHHLPLPQPVCVGSRPRRRRRLVALCAGRGDALRGAVRARPSERTGQWLTEGADGIPALTAGARHFGKND